jgi:SAM-dependent methyltransferase
MRDVPELVDPLRCPACAGPLSVEAGERAEDGHVIEGTLRCSDCAAAFPIVRGIPRLALGQVTERSQETTQRFGYQWRRAKASLGEGAFTAPETFLEFIEPVRQEDFRGKAVLDAGCGAGRFTRLAAEFGARTVVGVDLSDSVEVAFEVTRHLPNVLIVQAELERLPLARTLDYAFSVGVLHHTDDPGRSFASVARHVRESGAMSVWVYAREGNDWIVRFVDPVRKAITSRMPAFLVRGLAYLLALPLWAVLWLIYRPVGERKSLARMRRTLFYFDYLYFLSRFTYADVALILFDHLHPALAQYISRQELTAWFADSGMPDPVITARTGNSWRGFGTRIYSKPHDVAGE